MKIINQLETLDVHDCPINEFALHPAKKQITLTFFKFAKNQTGSTLVEILFKDIETFICEKSSFSLFSQLEIANLDVSMVQNFYQVNITLLTKPTEPEWNLTITCGEIEVI
jgi:hypothetical protein